MHVTLRGIILSMADEGREIRPLAGGMECA